MSFAQNRELARRYFDEIYQLARLELADDLLAPDAFYRGPLNVAVGAAAVKSWLAEWTTAFPDTRIEVEYWTGDDERLACRFMLRATFAAPFRGVEPTGRKLVLPMAFLFSFREGRISQIDAFWDSRHLQEQLGVQLPPVSRIDDV